MDKEFIPYEQALELKELGFDELCFADYLPHILSKYDGDAELFIGDRIGSKNSDHKYGNISAPLYQQAFRWFREKHNLDSTIFRHKIETVDGIEKKYFFGWFTETSDWGYSENYKTHEEAELACLKKLIEIVKTKNYE